jgi:hypothetical protein
MQHPVSTFVFEMSNMISAVVLIVVAFVLLPKLKLPTWVRVGVIVALFGDALARLTFAFNVLFYPGSTAGENALGWWVMVLHVGEALGFVAFLLGVAIQYGRGTTTDTCA